MRPLRPEDVALGALLVTLPLGPTATEVATGFALAVTGWSLWTRGRPEVDAPLNEPAVLLAAGLMVQVVLPGGLWNGLGRVWAWTPVWCVPVLLARSGFGTQWVVVGLTAWLAAMPAVLWQLGAVLLSGTPGENAVTGWFDHHLTLAGALLVPLGIAGWTRWRWGLLALVGLAGMVVASGSMAAILAASVGLGVAAVGTRRGPLAAGAGVGLLGGALGWAALHPAAEELRQRAILWTGGLQLHARGVSPGTQRDWIGPIHHQMDPTFDFPFHAHDTWIQLLIDAGPLGWIAVCWGALRLAQPLDPWRLGVMASLGVGALIQDGLGDLEVVRSLAVWLPLWLALDAVREGPMRHESDNWPRAERSRV